MELETPQILEICTYTGTSINISDIQPEDIHLIDIAHSLSMQCRFGGHCSTFYSVAQHSMWVAEHCPEELKLDGLLHDASEAYLVDIPKPVKRQLPDYQKLEDSVMKAIADRFNIQYPFHPDVKRVDGEALQYEWDKYMVEDTLDFENPFEVRAKFVTLFHKLSNAR